MSRSIPHASAARPPNDRASDLILWRPGRNRASRTDRFLTVGHRSGISDFALRFASSPKEGSMRVIGKACCLLALMLLAPRLAHAQASITGTVKDTSGAVLPGVTVEASSPVLIERVRSAITDTSGQYRIVD